jgi:hypothetical protein
MISAKKTTVPGHFDRVFMEFWWILDGEMRCAESDGMASRGGGVV